MKIKEQSLKVLQDTFNIDRKFQEPSSLDARWLSADYYDLVLLVTAHSLTTQTDQYKVDFV